MARETVDFERMIAEFNASTEQCRNIIGALDREADAAEAISRQLRSRSKKKLRLKSVPSDKSVSEPNPESWQARMRAFSAARIEQLKKEFYEPQNGREPPPDSMALEDAYFDAVRAKLNTVRGKLPRAVKRKR